MSKSWGCIEEPEQVKFKDIISEQILDSLKAESVVNLGDSAKTESSNGLKLNNSEENDGIQKEIIPINLNQESKKFNNNGQIEETAVLESLEDDINMKIKKEWEKLDCSECHLIPHRKCRPKESNITNHLKFFGKDRATELLMNFPEFQWYQINKLSGDFSSRSTSNHLKQHWQNLRENKVQFEFNDALDPFTIDCINKMIKNKLLMEIDGILSCDSTEAIVLHAQPNPNYSGFDKHAPFELALKIFKKNIYQLKTPPNFYSNTSDWNTLTVKNSSRRIQTRWAKIEIENLRQMRSAGILCPEPVFHTKHIVVMSFIGENRKPAPKLKNVKLDSEENEVAYNEVINAMRAMYQKLNLIHTDFFENNILWFKKHCYFIDFSQAIKTSNADAYDLLWKDCKTVTDFFKERNIPDILTQTELFEFITEFDYNNKSALTEHQKAMK